MKRDIDLIRLLLQKYESDDGKPVELEGYTVDQILYHDVLMEEAGLIKASFIKDIDGIVRTSIVLRLTNAGHDFLEASRHETIWNKYKEKTAKVGGGLMMAVATELLKKLVKDQLGLP